MTRLEVRDGSVLSGVAMITDHLPSPLKTGKNVGISSSSPSLDSESSEAVSSVNHSLRQASHGLYLCHDNGEIGVS